MIHLKLVALDEEQLKMVRVGLTLATASVNQDQSLTESVKEELLGLITDVDKKLKWDLK